MNKIENFCENTLSEADKLAKELETLLIEAKSLRMSLELITGPPKVYYFGCAKPFSEIGHYLYWRPFYSADRDFEKQIPWTLGELDGGLAPVLNPWCKDSYRRQECPQGVCSIIYKDKWTAISFWDRTGDQRSASNSTFLINSPVTFEEGIKLARGSWPKLFKRFEEAGLELKEYVQPQV